METHPEQVDVVVANINDNCQLLQSLAEKVEQEEGRGELKVSYLLVCTDYPALLMLAVKGLLCFFTKKGLEFTCTHLSITMFKHLTFPGGNRTRIPLYPTDWQKLPLV